MAALAVGSFEAQSVNHRGVILVLLLVVAGLAAAGIALWHQYRQTRRALDFWGADAASLIGHAPSVELIPLPRDPLDDNGPDNAHAVRQTVDLSAARGLVHFRRSLLEDRNFDWDLEPRVAAATDWDYRVRFNDDKASVVVAFDLNRQVVAMEKPVGGQAFLTARMAQGIAHFLDETLRRDD